MRVNVYAEEMTDRVELVHKTIDGHEFTAVRFYLELPATVGGEQYRGPFIHRPGDDDSSAVTFWGKRDLRPLLRKALALLDEHYADGDESHDGFAEAKAECHNAVEPVHQHRQKITKITKSVRRDIVLSDEGDNP